MKSWRPQNHYKTMGPFTMKILGRAPIDFQPTRIFDNCALIGNESFSCWLLETSEGLVLLDCMMPEHAPYIERCITELGYDPAALKYILVTHEHADHYGNAGYFQEKYGTKIYMSKIADDCAHNPEKDRGMRMPPMPFAVDGHLTDGGEFVCGDTVIKTYHTPGHSEGCMSFIFPVYDEGRPHMAGLWGGTGCPRQLERAHQQLNSFDKFSALTARAGVDVTVSNHPFQDNTMERLQLLLTLVDGVPNPFVMGMDGYKRFELMLREEITDAIYKMENGIVDDRLDKIVAQAAAADKARAEAAGQKA